MDLGREGEAAVEVVLVHPVQQAADPERARPVVCCSCVVPLCGRRVLGRPVVVVGRRIGPAERVRRRHGRGGVGALVGVGREDETLTNDESNESMMSSLVRRRRRRGRE